MDDELSAAQTTIWIFIGDPSPQFASRGSPVRSRSRPPTFFFAIIALAVDAFRSVDLRFSLDCTLEMRQPRWAHFAGKGLQSEAEAILTEVPADGC